MTEKQIALVKKTWKVYRDIDPLVVGDVFYSKLFTSFPNLRAMFTTSREQQSKKFIDMLSMIVGRLDKLDELSDDIAQLALRHQRYGVKFSHYDVVGDTLLWTLQQGLGTDWNEEVKEAWSLCYKTISHKMQAVSI